MQCPHSPNHLLADLPPADFELLRPHLQTMDLVQEAVLVAAGDRLTQAIFPHSGVISLVADTMTVGNAKSSISAPGGTLELAPFSSSSVSVAGTGGPGELLIDATLLSIIGGGDNVLDTVLIGGFNLIKWAVARHAARAQPAI